MGPSGHDYGDTPTSTIGTEKRQNPFMNFGSPRIRSPVTGGPVKSRAAVRI